MLAGELDACAAEIGASVVRGGSLMDGSTRTAPLSAEAGKARERAARLVAIIEELDAIAAKETHTTTTVVTIQTHDHPDTSTE